MIKNSLKVKKIDKQPYNVYSYIQNYKGEVKMKVSQLPYNRCTIEYIKENMGSAIERIKNAKTVDEVLSARKDYLEVMSEFSTQYSLSNCRYTLNTKDEFYLAEKDYYDCEYRCKHRPADT